MKKLLVIIMILSGIIILVGCSDQYETWSKKWDKMGVQDKETIKEMISVDVEDYFAERGIVENENVSISNIRVFNSEENEINSEFTVYVEDILSPALGFSYIFDENGFHITSVTTKGDDYFFDDKYTQEELEKTIEGEIGYIKEWYYDKWNEWHK